MDATRSGPQRQCKTCRETLATSEFPDRYVTAECAHRPNVCISCVENNIVQTLDEDLSEIIACPECGKPMTDDDIWRFSGPGTFERYEKMLRMNEDVECVVCAETLKGKEFPDCGITGTCTHEATTCNGCIAQHIRVQLDTRTWGQLSCPECPSPMTYPDVQRFATVETFQRYDALAMRDGIAIDAQFRWCPAPNCESGQIHNEGADAPIVTCISCGARSCFTHQRLWHEGLTCKEVENGVSPSRRRRRLTPQERADQEMAARLQQEEEGTSHTAAAQLRRESELATEREREQQAESREARETQQLLARQRAEEKASERKILGISKKCPGKGCSWRIQKTDGCDHMTFIGENGSAGNQERDCGRGRAALDCLAELTQLTPDPDSQAGGNLGRPVVAALIASGCFSVSILTRSAPPPTKFPFGVSIRVSDYSLASLASAFAGQDAVLSLIAGSAVLQQIAMVDAAVQAGVKRFVVSEWGADTKNEQAQSVVGVFKKKVSVVNHARTREGQGQGPFSWSAVVTGPWFDRSLPLGLLGFSIGARRALFHGTGSTPFATTTLTTICTSIIYLLTSQLAATKNRYVYLASFVTTQNEILGYLKRQSGIYDWTVERVESAEAARGAMEKVQKGEVGGVRELVTAQTFWEGKGGSWGGENVGWGIALEGVENVINDILTRPR
ncbi:MAG: hypothetical protein M1840_004334 [Geoglossum simile]|nr:MAG: hypothetical protein M1840_004334 [Geoglossum simile]